MSTSLTTATDLHNLRKALSDLKETFDQQIVEKQEIERQHVGNLNEIKRLKRSNEHMIKQLQIIANMPEDSIWKDDRDDAADIMVDEALVGLAGPDPEKQ